MADANGVINIHPRRPTGAAEVIENP